MKHYVRRTCIRVSRALGIVFTSLCVSAAHATIEISGTPKAAAPEAKKADAPRPSPARAPGAAPKPDGAPALSVGDTWLITRTDDLSLARIGLEFRYTVATASASEYVMQNGIRISPTLATLNTVVDGGKVTRNFQPGAFSLRFPLTTGKRWTESWDVKKPDGAVIARVTAQAHVVAIEQISVPAGAFESYRVAYTWRSTLSDGTVELGTRTAWYAPAVKYFVRVQYESTREDGNVLTFLTNELKSHSVAPR